MNWARTHLSKMFLFLDIGLLALLGYFACCEIFPTFKYFINIIKSVQPSQDFLVIIATVLGTFTAVAIPLSLNIISSKLNEYKDISVSELLKYEISYLGQILINIIVLLLIFGMKYFQWNHYLLNFGIFILTVVSVLLFFRFIKIVEWYATRTNDIIVDSVVRDFETILMDRKSKRVDERELLSRATSKSIQVFNKNIELSQEDSAEYLIDLIFLYVKKYFALRQINERKFIFLLYRKTTWSKIKELEVSDLTHWSFLSGSLLESYFALNKFANAILGFYENAAKSKKDYLVKLSMRKFADQLNDGEIIDNKIFLEFYLQIFLKISDINRRELDKTSILNISFACFGWYRSIKFRNPLIQDQEDLLDVYLFRTLKQLVDNDQEVLFKELVKAIYSNWVFEGGLASLKEDGSIYFYVTKKMQEIRDDSRIYSSEDEKSETDKFWQILWKLERRLDRLNDNLFSLTNNDHIETYLGEINLIFEIVNDEKEKLGISVKEVGELHQKMIEIGTNYKKLNTFRQIIVTAGAYCLYKEKYDYLNYLISYHYPRDAKMYKSDWSKTSILPYQSEQLLRLLISVKEIDSKLHSYWHEKHFAEQYLMLFFLSLLSYTNSPEFGVEIEKPYSLPQLSTLSVQQAFDLKQIVESLRDQYFELFVRNTSLLSTLKVHFILESKFPPGNTQIIDYKWNKLSSYLNALNEELDFTLSGFMRAMKLNPERMDILKKGIIEGFNSQGSIRNLLRSISKEVYNLNPRRLAHSTDKVILYENSYFIEGWPEKIDVKEIGIKLGERVAEIESERLIKSLQRTCGKSKGTFLEWCEKNVDSLESFIVVAQMYSFELDKLIDKNEFRPKWEIPNEYEPIYQHSFEGLYKNTLQIYTTRRPYDSNPKIFLIDIRHKNKFLHHIPINSADQKKYCEFDGINILKIRFESYKDNPQLIEKEKQNPSNRFAEILIKNQNSNSIGSRQGDLYYGLEKYTKITVAAQNEFRPNPESKNYYFEVEPE